MFRTMANILFLQESYQIFLDFPYFRPNKFVLHHEYSMKGFRKEFILQELSVAILWINENGGTCKMDLKFALKFKR